MQRVVFLKNLNKQYVIFKRNVKNNRKFINNLKLVTTFLILLFTVWVYWYFVNVSSTKWYFLRQEMRLLEEEKFLHSLTQLEVLKKQREVWQEIQDNSSFRQNNIGRQPQGLSVNDRVIYIKLNNHLTLNQ